MIRFLIGPELFWLLIYVAARLIGKANVPPTKAIDAFIENCYFWIPLLTVLVFALWYVPVVDKKWLLPRVWIVSLLGCHFALEKMLSYYSTQGPGIGMGYLAGMMLEFAVLVVGSIFVLIKF